MFTGIIQEIGEVESISYSGDKAKISLKVGKLAEDVKIGDSVSVSGVCLTAVSVKPGALEFDAVTTTLKLTFLNELKRGDRVNLEGALRFGDPLGGHLVSGHVDGVGRIRGVDRRPGETRFRIDASIEMMENLIERGSVAINGISLTVAKIHTDGFEVAIIPHTLSETTLATAREGDKVNLEGDMIGRWVMKCVAKIQGKGKITYDKLRDEGFLT